MNRRQFLGTMSLALTATFTDGIRRTLADAAPGMFAPVRVDERDPVTHVINRLTYGVTPALYAHVRRIGAAAFIEEQLSPESLDESEAVRRVHPFVDILNTNGGVLAERYDNHREVVSAALIGNAALRAVYSDRQLYERMVHLFSDHLNIYIGKGPTLFLKIDDDRDTVRPHAMGVFRQLIGASAHSPAMLIYLDNAQSTKDIPNENYSRELMELHTLGVNGGYTETDVQEVARAFTGWSVERERAEGGAINFRFRGFMHDPGAKTILGETFARRGFEQDGERVLDILAAHPSTARRISLKLARRFISDFPPDSVIEAGAVAYLASGGDIRQVLRVILTSQEFWDAPPKFKQPYEYLISTLRPFNYDIQNPERFLRAAHDPLDQMGNIPFTWPAPNGFPDVAGAWMSSLLPRWNVAVAVGGNGIPGAQADVAPLVDLMTSEGVAIEPEPVITYIARYLFGRSLTDAELGIVMDFVNTTPGNGEVQIAAGISLLLATPAYQYR